MAEPPGQCSGDCSADISSAIYRTRDCGVGVSPPRSLIGCLTGLLGAGSTGGRLQKRFTTPLLDPLVVPALQPAQERHDNKLPAQWQTANDDVYLFTDRLAGVRTANSVVTRADCRPALDRARADQETEPRSRCTARHCERGNRLGPSLGLEHGYLDAHRPVASSAVRGRSAIPHGRRRSSRRHVRRYRPSGGRSRRGPRTRPARQPVIRPCAGLRRRA
jgi:hypothetical protein